MKALLSEKIVLDGRAMGAAAFSVSNQFKLGATSAKVFTVGRWR